MVFCGQIIEVIAEESQKKESRGKNWGQKREKERGGEGRSSKVRRKDLSVKEEKRRETWQKEESGEEEKEGEADKEEEEKGDRERKSKEEKEDFCQEVGSSRCNQSAAGSEMKNMLNWLRREKMVRRRTRKVPERRS